MPKINSTNAKSLIIKFIVKIVFSTVLSVLVFTSLFSAIVLKLDIDIDITKYLGIVICPLTGFITSYISVGGFKNNLFPLSLISVFPFILFVIINFCVHGGSIWIIIAKIILIIAAALISSLLRLKKKKR